MVDGPATPTDLLTQITADFSDTTLIIYTSNTETIDEAILGGFIINVNNNVIDTSLKRQLSQFKKKLI